MHEQPPSILQPEANEREACRRTSVIAPGQCAQRYLVPVLELAHEFHAIRLHSPHRRGPFASDEENFHGKR